MHPATGGTIPHSNYLEMHVPVTNTYSILLEGIRIFKNLFVSNSVAKVYYTEHYPLLNPSNYNMFYAHCMCNNNNTEALYANKVY